MDTIKPNTDTTKIQHSLDRRQFLRVTCVGLAGLAGLQLLERKAKGQAAYLFIICVTTIIVVGGVMIIIKACKPKWYCVKMDDDNPYSRRWCVGLKPNEAQVNGWKILGGPYGTATQCDTNCITPVPPGNKPVYYYYQESPPVTVKAPNGRGPSLTSGSDPVTIHILKSPTVDGTFTTIATIPNTTPDDFEWSEVVPYSSPSGFYKVLATPT